MNDPTITYAGVDWATDDHAVCVVGHDGAVELEMSVEHNAKGLSDMCRRLRACGVRRVAIERGDGPVVDALLAAAFEVVVVTSRSVKALRERYGTSGNKSDRSDAYVLADCLRTDGHRWRSLEPDSPATVALRDHVRTRKSLVMTRVGVANQLRAHLQIVFPGAVGLFRDIDSRITLRFLTCFPSAGAALKLTPKQLQTWLKTNRYTGRTPATELLQHLNNAPAGPAEHDTRAPITIAFVNVLISIRAEIDTLERRIKELLDQHPDAHIFRSLPRCATTRAATLLAEIGDCRARFPDPESLCCLAGVAPSTRASGRHRQVSFRWSSDTRLRDAICDFAGDSWRGNEWAANRYHHLRDNGKSHPHATRILARSWTHIIWRCWQDNLAYDPARHRATNNSTS